MKPARLYTRPRGFTLTEIGVVLVVIAVILSLAVPALNAYRKRARTAVGLQHLSEIGKGTIDMAVARKNVLPFGYHPPPGGDPIKFAFFPKESDWAIFLNSYLTGSPNNYEDFPGGQIELLPIFQDPNATNPWEGHVHYSTHPVLMPDTDLVLEDPPDWDLYRLSRVRRPAEVILIMDATQRNNGNAYATTRNLDNTRFNPWSGANPNPLYDENEVFYDKSFTDNNDPIDPGTNDESVSSTGNIAWRQGGKSDVNPALLTTTALRQAEGRAANWAANFVFLDGHVATLKPQQVTKKNVRVDR